MNKKRIAIFGSTGSIGTQALEVIAAHPDHFEVEALTTFNRHELLIQQAF
ncbi:MAG: 1-deoxy-D-xylulose-5-phosphate reductoisomerase, partial [Bacteroidales bacterium]